MFNGHRQRHWQLAWAWASALATGRRTKHGPATRSMNTVMRTIIMLALGSEAWVATWMGQNGKCDLGNTLYDDG
eukprot:9447195-Alexandrium_andersonii.AAC.1